ncbi:hypothetical protein CPB83DRAFT_769552 [Crepidotus variabilis]|uniref:EF-hand domain-containing protein n=1 Tax=Crepidotus variabilis TaxID=179855 RepID=A0A9P6JN86_9AGAR|nr:hypothetical protein CPB83DRAFT_769552 [Crepidotus variabilis]
MNFREIRSLEEAANSFTDKAQTMVKGLRTLGTLHPFVGVAVGAFVLVITLDLVRRDNDRKVFLVKLKMSELMSVFFELRHFKDSEDKAHDGLSIADRLAPLMAEIANDIKAAGSACDAYLKKGFLSKTVKASTYEGRLANFIDTFADHRNKLELSFALHTSLGVDAANEKLDEQSVRLKAIEEKLDAIALFRQVDTPREKDVQKFISEHGGVKSVLNNDDFLEELISKSGESFSRISGREAGRKSNDLPSVRKRLLKEVLEDVDEVFNRNMVLFEKKLDMQSKQLTETLQSESDRVIQTLLSGAHDRIIDPDLQRIWKDMGWKGSVKARHFVLALHDYYTDKLSSTSSDLPVFDSSTLPSPPSSRASPVKSPNTATFRRQSSDDKWALSYINAAYVQPILEAVDDDGTGFVSVKEVNTFVASRPDGWSLPTWIAYWAVGWQASISQYKSKIYTLVQEMFRTLEHVLPSNRRAVDEYLFHPSFWRIELLLRSTRSVNFKVLSDPDLARAADSYTAAEEERLDNSLSDVAYELDTTATVQLITGEGRIERYVFPLIYLLLRQHLKVMTLGCKHVLDTEELSTLNESLVSILLLVDDRIQNLEAVFKQTHLDIQARLGNFAFGIFQLSYGDIKRVPIQNSFGTWVDDDENSAGPEPITAEVIHAKYEKIPLSILKYGIQDGFQSTDYFEFEPARLRRVSHAIQGTWTGHCQRSDGDEVINYVLRISFRVSSDLRSIKGKGEDFANTFNLEGRVFRTKGGYELEFALSDDDEETSAFGFLDTTSETLIMSWSDRRRKTNYDDPYYEPINMRKTPPSLIRYRYKDHQFAEDPIRARWAFACSAALHLAQEKMWSRRFLEARATERKRFVELSTRSLIVKMGLTPQKPLNPAEKGELEYLRRELNPSEARFYHALSQFEIQKLPWHPAWGCDWCTRRITKSRLLCLHCMTDNLSDNIDLCAVCIDKSPSKRGFVHDISHDVVKIEETLHDFNFTRVIDTARTVIGRVKGIFRTLESANGSREVGQTDGESGDETRADPTCACCRQRVSTPCWTCVTCTKDTFVCMGCDTQRVKSLSDGPSPHHKLNHPLVKVRDSSIAGADATAEERLVILQQRLVAMERQMTSGLAGIDAKVEERLSNLEHRVEARLAMFEANSELRFDALEAVLRQLVAQTAALPSLYAQVVKDQIRSSMPPSPRSPRWFQ